VLNRGLGNKQRKLATLHEICQQQGVFGPECGRVKQTVLNIHAASSNGKSRSVQVSNAPVRLEHVTLKSSKP
jgi:hypothetical protein